MAKSQTQDPLLYGRLQPQAVDLEKAILGAILLEKTALERVQEHLTADSFYTEAHQSIYTAIEKLAAKNSAIDLLTVVAQLKSMGALELAGGIATVAKLTNGVVSSAHIEAHAQIIQEKYTLRRLILTATNVLNQAYEDTADVKEILAAIEQGVTQVTAGLYRTDYKSLGEIIPGMLQEIDQLQNNSSDLTGVPSGFPHLDRTTLGWQPGDLIILAARPSVGKTAFALNLIRNAWLRGYNAGLFALEMTGIKITKRLTSMDSRIPLHMLKSGRLQDRGQLLKASERLVNAGIFIDDSFTLNISELKAKARRMVNKHGVKLIIVDYLQLMSGTGGKNSNREQEISTISRGLKQLAKELHVPIIALSQLSREIEKRNDKMPQLSDLRESGAIEQDADMVMFLWRPSEAQRNEDAALRTKAMLKIAKFRDGALDDYVFEVQDEIQLWEIIGPLNPYKQPAPTFDEKVRWKKIEHDEE